MPGASILGVGVLRPQILGRGSWGLQEVVGVRGRVVKYYHVQLV